jgi:hypothetical protein
MQKLGSMFRALVFLYCSVFGVAIVLALAGIKPPKIIVIPPSDGSAGETILVSGDTLYLNYLDSAEAYCERCLMVWPWCRKNALAGIMQHDVHVKLPYSGMLFRMTGANPEIWQSMPEGLPGSD